MFRNNEEQEPVVNATIHSAIKYDKGMISLKAEELQKFKEDQIKENRGTSHDCGNY